MNRLYSFKLVVNGLYLKSRLVEFGVYGESSMGRLSVKAVNGNFVHINLQRCLLAARPAACRLSLKTAGSTPITGVAKFRSRGVNGQVGP